MEEQITYKIILVGDSSVGKTCIYSKYTKNQYPKVVVSTVGQEFKTKAITMSDGKSVKANIWDTAGQERYRSLMASNYRKAVGCILVYDITQRPTFERLQMWVEDIKQQSEPGIVITVVGNKTDLETARMVSKAEGEQYAKQNNFHFFETSALNGTNVTEVFEHHLNQIYTFKNKDTSKQGQPVNASIKIANQSADQQQNQPPREMGESSCKC